jgi:hypothetical protein
MNIDPKFYINTKTEHLMLALRRTGIVSFHFYYNTWGDKWIDLRQKRAKRP